MLVLQEICKEVALVKHLTCMTCKRLQKKTLCLPLSVGIRKGFLLSLSVFSSSNTSCYPQHVLCINFRQL